MTTSAVALLVAAGAFAVGDWVARAPAREARVRVQAGHGDGAHRHRRGPRPPRPTPAARRAWFVAALVCSLVGDVLLMLPADLFVAGLAAFLVGHLCYVAGFWVHGPGAIAFLSRPRRWPSWWRPWPSHPGRVGTAARVRVPVALYIVVISVMLATALATGNVAAGVGAALFVSSDTMIAWNRFVRPFRGADVGIMVTYHLGQAGLVLSLLH